MSDLVQLRVVDGSPDVLDRSLRLLREDDARVLDPRWTTGRLVGGQHPNLSPRDLLLVDRDSLQCCEVALILTLQDHEYHTRVTNAQRNVL